MNRNLLIDGNNLLHRVFFAFVNEKYGDKAFVSNSGYEIGMIYGSISILSNVIPCLGNINSIYFFCDGYPSRRRFIDPSYKTRKNKEKNSFIKLDKSITLSDGFEANNEIDALYHILQLFGVKIYHSDNEEADDLIASFITKNPDDVNIILSSDKDFFQLLDNNKVVVCKSSNGGGYKLLDKYNIEEYWSSLNGGKHPPVSADCVRMFKTLCGDPSDNIPGIFRLRKKIAADVSIKYKNNLDGLINDGWPTFSVLEKERAESLIDRIRLNWELVGLYNDIELKCINDTEQNYDTAFEILKNLNIYLDCSFFSNNKNRIITDDVPVKVLNDDWLSSV